MTSLRLMHVITGLPVGGAQRMLEQLAVRLHRRGWPQLVVSLTDRDVVGRRLEEEGVPVRALGGGYGPGAVAGLWRLSRWIRDHRPAVVQSWLYHADLAAGLAVRLARVGPSARRRFAAPAVVWGIRHSGFGRGGQHDVKLATRAVARACATLSRRLPDRVVCNSRTAREVHAALGYDDGRMLVIPNGIDTDRFRPDPAARRSVRRELGLPEGTPLVGMAAEARPQKDHRCFLEAAARLVAAAPGAHFLLCGRGADPDSRELAGWIRESGLEGRVHLLGLRSDMPRLLAALDVAALTSRSGESFPTVVADAIACGVPVAATAVGDTAEIVGPAGRVVPPERPGRMAEAWGELLEAGREARERLGRAARGRVRERYALAAVVDRYRSLYRELAAAGGGPASSRGGGPASRRVADPDGADPGVRRLADPGAAGDPGGAEAPDGGGPTP